MSDQYRTNDELRQNIAYAIGSDPSRYADDHDLCLLKSELVEIGRQTTDRRAAELRALTVGELYPIVADSVGAAHDPTAGNPWRLNRNVLKPLHAAVADGAPDADPLATPLSVPADAETVGDLDADAVVLRFPNSNTVHLPGGHCSQLTRETGNDATRKRAATLFDDAEICADCRDEQFRGGGERTTTLPTQTEVPSDD